MNICTTTTQHTERSKILISIIGPPVFAADNIRIQKSNTDAPVQLKVKVSSSTDIICHNITEVGNPSFRQQDMEVRLEPILIKESSHGVNVTVKGIDIIFVLHKPHFRGSSSYNITVCNSYGHSSIVVNSKQVGKLSYSNHISLD